MDRVYDPDAGQQPYRVDRLAGGADPGLVLRAGQRQAGPVDDHGGRRQPIR